MTWIEYINQSEQHMLAALFALDNMISTVMEPCTKWAVRRHVRSLGVPSSVSRKEDRRVKNSKPRYCSECRYCSINCSKQELANTTRKLSEYITAQTEEDGK